MSKCCIIKSNTPELRQRLEQSGISVCICSSFKEADWLCCWESNMAYDVHGVYPDEVDDLTGETYQELYLKEVNPIVCESEDFLQTTITVSLLFGITILLTTNYYGNN